MLKNSKKIKKIDQNDKSQKPEKKDQFDIEIFQDHAIYDFDELAIYHDPLSKFVYINEGGVSTIDWKNPEALKTLTQAIIQYKFGFDYWDISLETLCPTVPSRLNYLTLINELFVQNIENLDTNNIKAIDIGTGSSLIYPLLGLSEFNWNFTATEVNKNSLQNAQNIIEKNDLKEYISLVQSSEQYEYKNTIKMKNKSKQHQQTEQEQNTVQVYPIFKNIIPKDEQFFFTVCNPPFFSDSQARQQVPGKNSNILDHENYVQGGETEFIYQMIEESKLYKDNITIFTTLVGVKSHFFELKDTLRELKQNKTIENFFTGRFKQGKNTRWVLAWTYKKDLKFKKTNNFDNF